MTKNINIKEKDLIEYLKDFLIGKVIILGMGNSMRGDDTSGVELAKRLRGKVPAEVFECGTKIDNFINLITDARPDAILIIDSYDFKEKAGSMKLMKMRDMEKMSFMAYADSTRAFIDSLILKSRADIALLGIQPSHNKLNLEMSKEVQEAIAKLEEIVTKIFSRR